MGELRKDYFRERYVIISPERARRPDEFRRQTQEIPKITPFTPGNEQALVGILAEFPAGPNWQFRVVPNKFAIVRPEGEAQLNHTSELFTWANNYGFHEVVIEGREDGVPFSSLGPEGMSAAIAIGIDRVRRLQLTAGIEYVAYFKNEGLEAGASIQHPHSQVIAMAVVPPSIPTLVSQYAQLRVQYGFSPLYKILDRERGGVRIIAETTHFVALCPYASRFPMEVLFIPLREAPTYITMTDEERLDLAELLHKILTKLAGIGSAYNLEWMHAKDNAFHWHLSLTPRLSIWAGYEIETNIIVNPIPPEHAAAFYRGS